MPDHIVKSKSKPDADGTVVKVTPESAGWDWVGFEVVRLPAGQTLERNTGNEEVCLVVLSGRCNVSSGENEWRDVGERESPFDGPLIEKVSEAAQDLKVGPGYEDGELTPLIRDSHRQRVKEYVDLGEEEGAQVVLDGCEPPRVEGFFGPTILDNVNGEMRVAREEIFGPVLSVVRVENLDEAIEFTNASPFGNACSIYTENGAAVRHWREHVEAGMLGVNVGVAAPMAFFPFNGVKNSFYGDLHATGKDGVRFFTENKVEISRFYSDPDDIGPPVTYPEEVGP